MIITYTGPSELTRKQRLFAAKRMLMIKESQKVDVMRSGCAFGLDTEAAWLSMALKAELELFVPFGAHNDQMRVILEPLATRVIYCPSSIGRSKGYRVRNEMMVLGVAGVPPCDLLHAFTSRVGFYRSGEWMTINIAKKAQIPYIVEVLP